MRNLSYARVNTTTPTTLQNERAYKLLCLNLHKIAQKYRLKKERECVENLNHKQKQRKPTVPDTEYVHILKTVQHLY
jgi:thiamine biosynthesis lipoprotein ApbE